MGGRRVAIIGALGLFVLSGCATGGMDASDVKIGGSLRYRHETVDHDNWAAGVDEEKQVRQRVQAKVNLGVDVNEEVDLKFALVSGGTDPASTNQTLDGGWTTKGIQLDIARFDYHPVEVENLHILGGKMKMPFHKPGKSELIWDGDLRPEGIAVKYKTELFGLNLSAVAGGFWIEENSADVDTSLFGATLAIKKKISDELSITGGVGLYDYGNIQDEDLIGGSTFGNSEDILGSGGDYLEDYNLIDVFVEVSFKIQDIPVLVFGEKVKNNGADDDEDEGTLFGVKVGKVKDVGSYAFRFIWRETEADAVVGAYTDSDFIGGGTNGEGSEIGFDYQIADNTTASVTYFMNTIDKARTVTLDDEDYNRLQVDVKFKF